MTWKTEQLLDFVRRFPRAPLKPVVVGPIGKVDPEMRKLAEAAGCRVIESAFVERTQCLPGEIFEMPAFKIEPLQTDASRYMDNQK